MSVGADYWQVSVEEARAAPIPDGVPSAVLMRHGALSVRYYAPKGTVPR